ncbi:MAG: DUF1311 domain-containing protein [Rhodobacter sp.]|nr:DUF1311 domain-containing protein [Paracoccaceae bacterium]MCC0072938.1 DUF1311 domain-containing protein [Rhodobacter sp.]
MECPGGSQVEISVCLGDTLDRVDQAIVVALGYAQASASDLDETTGREDALPAIDAAQAAWSAYRDAQCEAVGAGFGGGSGTTIAIRACRIALGRARVDALLAMAH